MLSAQIFSPVIFSDFRKPFRFDYLEPSIDLSYLKFPHELQQKSLTTFDGKIDVGVPKYFLWERLMFLLSMNGQVPLSNLCKNIRITDNKIVCSNEYSKIAEIHFNRCIYFGDNNTIISTEQNTLDKTEYICYDWIAFNKGGKHEIDFFETDDRFVNKVWFYPSDRIDGNTAVRDACAVSSLTAEQIEDFNYSETMARFKLIHNMEERGMRGLFNGYGPNGKPKYYKFKTTHIRREKHCDEKRHDYGVDGIESASVKQEDLLKNLSQSYMDYNRFLRGLGE